MSPSLEHAPATRSRDAASTLVALAQLTKPGVTRMVVLTTAIGGILAPGRVDMIRLGWTVLATLAVVSAANTLNMYLERDVDALMPRTRERPIPSGRVSPEVALGFGVALAFAGLVALTFLVNALSGLLCAIALISYVLVYTPLKRITPFALHVGTLPGAIPPLIGWAGMTGKLSLAALSVFLILLVWQIPHFLAIAIFRAQEYESAGLAVYPSVRGVPAAKRAVVGYSLLLMLVSLVPALLGLGGALYVIVAAALGITQVVIAYRGLAAPDLKRWAGGLFLATLPYLLVVYGCLALTAP
ncbi:MAG: heme o synthase [Polyangiaceae bacterium]